MKRNYCHYSALWIGIVLLPLGIFAQCPDKRTMDSISAPIKKDGFLIVEKYTLDIKSDKDRAGKASFSYLFTKGTSYIICLVDPYFISGSDPKGAIGVMFFDKRDFLFFGTHSGGDEDKYYNKILFNCRTTGLYEFQFQVRKEKVCGNILIAMKKTSKMGKNIKK